MISILCSPFSNHAQKNDSLLWKKSMAFDWNKIDAIKTNTGEKRQFFNSITETLDILECHLTTLKPQETAHLPHQHPEEEMIIIKDGNVEALVDGDIKRIGPGSVIFQAANHLHTIKNIGNTNAIYFAIKWRSAKTGNVVK